MADIVISEFMDAAAVERLKQSYAVSYDPGLVDRPEELGALLADARVLIVRNRTQVRPALLEKAAKLTCVGRLGVGLDNIDVEACKARGIAVYPANGANDLSVAEYVITAALVLLRQAWLSTADMIAGAWPRQKLMGAELAGKTLGLVGYGAIAREVARRAAALGVACVGHDPFLPSDSPAWGDTQPLALDDLLARADIVSLHVPLTPATQHLIDARAMARMKKGSLLINAARGGVVDEAALVEALRSGHLAGAALDVFEHEPLTADAGRLFAGLGNLILTPHIAGVTLESNVRVSNLIADKVAAHLEGAE
ncbi:MAG TPA: hydroxyacid dehydrogenase [Devosia sp.]|nr:hydroxyacid dehydrogenase [Devosia sp.]